MYFPPAQLAALLIELGKARMHPHMHADGDAAVRAGLDAVVALRAGLSRDAVLEAATINAAYELDADRVIGSLESGKCADMIVLDRNPLTIPEDVANVKVLQTVIGGRVVYRAAP